MRKRLFILTAATLFAAGAAVAADKAPPTNLKGEAELAKLLAGREPGKPVNCISATQSQSSRVVQGTAIVYQSTSRTLYVNRPKIGADQLGRDDILVTRIWGSQLCNLDQIRLVDRTSRFQRGFVSLGDFVPYTRVKAG